MRGEAAGGTGMRAYRCEQRGRETQSAALSMTERTAQANRRDNVRPQCRGTGINREGQYKEWATCAGQRSGL